MRGEKADLSWSLVPDLTKSEPALTPASPPQLLWLKDREEHPDGYGYSRLCELYRRWHGGLDSLLRQEHKVGEKVLVDYGDQTVTGARAGRSWTP